MVWKILKKKTKFSSRVFFDDNTMKHPSAVLMVGILAYSEYVCRLPVTVEITTKMSLNVFFKGVLAEE